jgi:hypothetical protein
LAEIVENARNLLAGGNVTAVRGGDIWNRTAHGVRRRESVRALKN